MRIAHEDEDGGRRGSGGDPAGGERGYSLIEVMVVLTCMAIVAAMAVPLSQQAITTAHADSATTAALAALSSARDRAVAERRNFEVSFVMPNLIRIERDEVPSGLRTLIADIPLEGGQQFVKFAALPDTPDAFGNAAAITIGGTGPWMFTSDGGFIDSNGDNVNGTILIGVPNQPTTARAATVFGVTGLMRSWKWRGARWFE